MVGALKALGVQLEEDWEHDRLVVQGCGGRFPSQGGDLFLGNAGTAMRPLTAAVAAAGRGRFVLDGVARMRERPIQDLVDGLVQVGARRCAVLCWAVLGCAGLAWAGLRRLGLRGMLPRQPATRRPPFDQPRATRACAVAARASMPTPASKPSTSCRCCAACPAAAGRQGHLHHGHRLPARGDHRRGAALWQGVPQRLGQQPVPDRAAHGGAAGHRNWCEPLPAGCPCIMRICCCCRRRRCCCCCLPLPAAEDSNTHPEDTVMACKINNMRPQHAIACCFARSRCRAPVLPAISCTCCMLPPVAWDYKHLTQLSENIVMLIRLKINRMRPLQTCIFCMHACYCTGCHLLPRLRITNI